MSIIQQGLFRLRNVATGELLEVAEGSSRSGARVRRAPDDGSAAQRWRISPVHPGAALYHLENAASGKRLDVRGAATENGVPVQQWSANAFGAQEWLLERHDDAPDTYTLVAIISGKNLDLTPEGLAHQWEDTDSPTQWWHLEPA
ncbi:RICIN domain-containing protein [Kitasatospora cinereorecta]|uniref:RICIN domain-containing protein n=1 Tax=Kitasatospora cinereorecta TaxID=285560 RepID=A0ABW0VGN7_9ACTN